MRLTSLAFSICTMCPAVSKISTDAPGAFRGLVKEQGKKESPELRAELNRARRLGIISSGWVMQEVDDFSKAYEQLMNPKPSFFRNPLKAYWQLAKHWTNLRENVIRLAAFRHFKTRIENGERGVYAASKKPQIDAIRDDTERAAKLARELIGDYGDLSR